MNTHWTAEQDARLLDLTGRGWTANDIALDLDRSPRAIHNRRSVKCVAATPASDGWTAEQTAIVINGVQRYVPYAEIARQTGRSYGAVKKKVSHLRKTSPALLIRTTGETPCVIVTDHAAHVRACLRAGGFGSIEYAPRPQRLFVWRAA